MTIGIIFGQVYYGAVRAYNEAHALSLNSQNDIKLLCYNDIEKQEVEVKNNITTIKFPYNKAKIGRLFGINNTIPFFTNKWANIIEEAIIEYNIEYLLVHDIFMLPATFKAAKKIARTIPITVNLHENYPEVVKTYTWANKLPHKYLARPDKWEKMEGKLLSKVDKIIVLSAAYKKTLLRKYSFLKSQQFFIFPNIPNLSVFNTYKIKEIPIKKETKDFILFYFGIIGLRRGLNVCIEAVEDLRINFPNIKLLIVGPIENSEQTYFLDKIGTLDNSIIYKDWISIEEFPSYANISDVCICPIIKNAQHESGIANKVFQYMWAAKPLIVSNCLPQQTLVEEEKCGLVFESENKNDLKEKILTLYKDRNMCKLMGENGQKAIDATYNLNQFGLNFSKFILENESL